MKKHTLKISDFIQFLEDMKKQAGDLPVFISTDAEGNSFGTLLGSYCTEDNILVIYPNEDNLFLEEILK